MESPSASPASPQTTRQPFWAMNALMWPTRPRTTMSTPFIEMPQRADASPSTTSRPPRPAAHADGRLLVHPGPVVAHVALDLGLDRGVQADGERVRAARVDDAPARRQGVGDARERVQARVELAPRGRREVEGLDGHTGLDRHQTRSRSQMYTRAGSGSQTTASAAPGRTAIARYSDAIATHSSVSAITAGLQAIGSRSTAKPSAVPTAKV